MFKGCVGDYILQLGKPGDSMLIQKLRLQRGWSQQQLADLSGLSVRTMRFSPLGGDWEKRQVEKRLGRKL